MSLQQFKTKYNLIDIQEIAPKDIGVRKKLHIYEAIDNNKNSFYIISISQKSRVLQKDVVQYEEIYQKVQEFTKITFTYKLISIEAPLCSKAKAKLELLYTDIIEI